MDLSELLRMYRDGKISEEEVVKRLRIDHLEILENRIRYDLSREARSGFPEAVLGLSKTPQDIAKIVRSVLSKRKKIFVTKLEPQKMDKLKELLEEEPLPRLRLSYHETANLLVASTSPRRPRKICTVGIIAAGTSDIPIAEEARVVCDECGLETVTAYDVGVAGLHRLFSPLTEMLQSDVDVVIVVAGMEGALPSVVKGLVDVPVIGVPTSVGYGYRGGESALIAMLNSCVPGLVITNIDNGFGAAAASYLICSRIAKYRSNSSTNP